MIAKILFLILYKKLICIIKIIIDFTEKKRKKLFEINNNKSNNSSAIQRKIIVRNYKKQIQLFKKIRKYFISRIVSFS